MVFTKSRHKAPPSVSRVEIVLAVFRRLGISKRTYLVDENDLETFYTKQVWQQGTFQVANNSHKSDAKRRGRCIMQ